MRSIEDIEVEQRKRIEWLRSATLFKPPPRSWARPVYSDRGEKWESMQKMAEELGVDRGTGYVCIANGVRCKGRMLSYSPLLAAGAGNAGKERRA